MSERDADEALDDDRELGDAIRERLGNAYWRLSEQTSGAAAIGMAVIRDLLDYADKTENNEIRRMIAAHVGVEVSE